MFHDCPLEQSVCAVRWDGAAGGLPDADHLLCGPHLPGHEPGGEQQIRHRLLCQGYVAGATLRYPVLTGSLMKTALATIWDPAGFFLSFF